LIPPKSLFTGTNSLEAAPQGAAHPSNVLN
jgi:hypothetical protein